MRLLRFHRFLRWTVYSVLSGVLSGGAAAVFLWLLDWATQTRDQNLWLIWGLPLGGFLIGWVYHRYGGRVASGNNLILDEIHDPKKIVPLRMAPFVLLGTVLTHLLGGSAGREGTAVQMGASLSDQLSRFFRVEPDERKILLMAGAGAGFGAALGTPWAGALFGMEVLRVGRLRLFAWWECLVSSFVAYGTALLLKAPHTIYPRFEIPKWETSTIFYIVMSGVFFGLSARLFVAMAHFVERWSAKLVVYSPLRPFGVGLLLILFYRIEGSYRYVGLGLTRIQNALTSVSSLSEPVWKAFFTALTVGSGFKGGEFIPLVFIGTTLGSALSAVFPISLQLLAGVGFAAVFAGASNTPLACSIMAMEIFGPKMAPYALVACYVSFLFSGTQSIYKSQKYYADKWRWFRYLRGILIDNVQT